MPNLEERASSKTRSFLFSLASDRGEPVTC